MKLGGKPKGILISEFTNDDCRNMKYLSTINLAHTQSSSVGSKTQSSTSEGWDSGWGTFDEEGEAGLSKQELLQKKKEERRLKQQAAREKRASGKALKPGGLGAVKKD